MVILFGTGELIKIQDCFFTDVNLLIIESIPVIRHSQHDALIAAFLFHVVLSCVSDAHFTDCWTHCFVVG